MTGKQLRNSILQWAIQGKLVPQDPNDEPASVLLERIRAEKARLVKEKKIKKDKNESVIFRGEDNSYYEKKADGTVRCIDSEIPFDIPHSWAWARLKTIGITETGTTPSKEHPEYFGNFIPFLGPSNIQNNTIASVSQGLSEQGMTHGRIVPPNTILQVCIGGSIGKCAIVNKPVSFNQQINSVTPILCNTNYIFYNLQSDVFKTQIIESSTGTATPIINRSNWESLLIPIPPLEEQSRIAIKVEMLQPLIAKYDAAEKQLTSLNAALNQVLKKSVLQEAIQGRLVPQIESEGTAEELLSEIRSEKLRLVNEGKLKKSVLNNESRIFQGEDNRYYEQICSKTIDITDLLLFDIPENWRCCRLSNVIQLLSGRDLEPNEYNDTHKGLPYMTGASNFSSEELLVNRWTENPVTLSTKGDLLITCKGTIGQMAFNTIGEIHIARQIMAIRGYRINLHYLKFFLESIMNTLQKQAKSMIPGISREVLLNTLFPLPPRAEQNRIVHELSELLQKMN